MCLVLIDNYYHYQKVKKIKRHVQLILLFYLSSTTPFTTKATDTNSILVALIVLILVAIIVLVAGILFYKCTYAKKLSTQGTSFTINYSPQTINYQ